MKTVLEDRWQEVTQRIINYPSIHSSAMEIITEYLYSGCLEEDLTCASVFCIVEACRYFIMPELRDYTLTYISNSLTNEWMDADCALWCFEELATSVSFDNQVDWLGKSAPARLAKDLVRKINVGQADALNRLSSKGFNLYIDATSIEGSNEVLDFTVVEYLRLRKVLLWASSKVSYNLAIDFRRYLPDAEILMKKTWKTLKADLASALPVTDPMMRQRIIRKISKLTDPFTKIRLSKIHPVILSRLISALKLRIVVL